MRSQDIFADILEDSRFYGSKELMGRRIADLMQARSALLSSAAEARLQTVESEHSGRLQHLKLEMADKECKVCFIILPSALRWLNLSQRCEAAAQMIGISWAPPCMRLRER